MIKYYNIDYYNNMNINGIPKDKAVSELTMFNILFLQEYDNEYDYDDNLSLRLTKMLHTGYVDLINNRINTTVRDSKIKVKIEINLTYKYVNAVYAPRFRLNVYKNSDIITTRYCGTMDSIDDPNTLRMDLIIDVLHNDEIIIEFSKDVTEDSISKIMILQNSYIVFKNI